MRARLVFWQLDNGSSRGWHVCGRSKRQLPTWGISPVKQWSHPSWRSWSSTFRPWCLVTLVRARTGLTRIANSTSGWAAETTNFL